MDKDREINKSTVKAMLAALAHLYSSAYKNYVPNMNENIVTDLSDLGDLLNSHLKVVASHLEEQDNYIEDGD